MQGVLLPLLKWLNFKKNVVIDNFAFVLHYKAQFKNITVQIFITFEA